MLPGPDCSGLDLEAARRQGRQGGALGIGRDFPDAGLETCEVTSAQGLRGNHIPPDLDCVECVWVDHPHQAVVEPGRQQELVACLDLEIGLGEVRRPALNGSCKRWAVAQMDLAREFID